jgi:hypothetical protein
MYFFLGSSPLMSGYRAVGRQTLELHAHHVYSCSSTVLLAAKSQDVGPSSIQSVLGKFEGHGGGEIEERAHYRILKGCLVCSSRREVADGPQHGVPPD